MGALIGAIDLDHPNQILEMLKSATRFPTKKGGGSDSRTEASAVVARISRLYRAPRNLAFRSTKSVVLVAAITYPVARRRCRLGIVFPLATGWRPAAGNPWQCALRDGKSRRGEAAGSLPRATTGVDKEASPARPNRRYASAVVPGRWIAFPIAPVLISAAKRRRFCSSALQPVSSKWKTPPFLIDAESDYAGANIHPYGARRRRVNPSIYWEFRGRPEKGWRIRTA